MASFYDDYQVYFSTSELYEVPDYISSYIS